MNKQDLQNMISSIHEDGNKVAVSFCSHVPQEILTAAGLTSLRIPYIRDVDDAASKILIRNLCPVVKNTCDICEDEALKDADLVIAETSCDGKKKMYELISNQERVHFYQVAQGADRDYVKPLIYSECKYLAKQLEKRFGVDVTDENIRKAGALYNDERDSVLSLMEIQAQTPPAAWGRDIFQALHEHRLIADPAQRAAANLETREQLLSQPSPVPKRAKRILVTGCPMSGVYTKVLDAIENNGGVVVCFENCETLKPAIRQFDTEAEDVYQALADCYQNTACAIMAPNDLRFQIIGGLVNKYQVDGVLDVMLQTCHAYTVERDKMSRFCEDALEIPYMSIETDAGDSDGGQLATRVAAFIEIL